MTRTLPREGNISEYMRSFYGPDREPDQSVIGNSNLGKGEVEKTEPKLKSAVRSHSGPITCQTGHLDTMKGELSVNGKR